jgi:hypothetical protein
MLAVPQFHSLLWLLNYKVTHFFDLARAAFKQECIGAPSLL